jgi:hypothetical protein
MAPNEQTVEAEGHHVVSAKTVPSSQPTPAATKTTANSAANRATQGGKGRKGEEALEHAVAAREEVERRRAHLKEANGVGVAGARQLDENPVKVKMEEEENVEIEVVHGEEAETIAALPVSSLLSFCHHVLELTLCAPIATERKTSNRRRASWSHSIRRRYERHESSFDDYPHRTQEYLPEATTENAEGVHRTSSIRPSSLQYGYRQERVGSSRRNHLSTFRRSKVCGNRILCYYWYRTSQGESYTPQHYALEPVADRL